MLFSLVYFLVRRFLGAADRRPDEKDIELLVLRHQRDFWDRMPPTQTCEDLVTGGYEPAFLVAN